MEPIVGIDLGTTNSEIAFIIDDQAQLLAENNQGILPSCVGLDAAGRVIVGSEAKNQAAIDPENTILSIKRKMGSDEKIRLKDTTYSPQEISAFILKALKERAERVLKQPVSKAVITVPAYFTDAQRQATREAGELAGLNVIRILNEPTAAALAYESNNTETQQILVYDLGGGTFDVSIVKIENNVVEVLASTGDNHLGGDDFDQKIVDRLTLHVENELKLSVKSNPVLIARLRRAAENAKIALSDKPYATIEEDHIGKKMLKDVHLSFELSREDFEEMIDDDLERTMESVNKALKDANLLAADIDKIILVGGSTRIPKLSELLERKFNLQPHSEIDPDLCVAFGAAIQAGREMGIDTSGVLIDITPYTFGTSAIGSVNGIQTPDKYIPLIRRNTKLPANKTEAFETVHDRQKVVNIDVFQGEQPYAPDNVKIGDYMFTLSELSAGSVITLNFDLDLNGILKIEAVERKTGKKINAVIENALKEFSAEEMETARNKIDAAWAGTPDNEKNDADEEDASSAMPPDLSQLLEKAKSQMSDAPEEDRDEIVNLIEDIHDAVNRQDLSEAREMAKELEDILFYIEE